MIGQDLIESLLETEMAASGDTAGWVLITDQNVERIYHRIIQDLKAGAEELSLPFLTLAIPPGESSKSLSKVEDLAGIMAREGFGRKTKIIALGGGVVGDMAGFLASIYMRGVAYIQIPTTLLSQVDSSIGGKTGVNLLEGKNLLGSFYPPKSVWIDGNFLTTLKREDWINGYGELLKHGIIKDPQLFTDLEQKYQQNSLYDTDSRSLERLTLLILKGISVKQEIVEADEKEEGLRRLLNYGHTFGHALEALYHYQGYSHGTAVLKGMIWEGEMALHLGILNKEDFRRIRALIEGILPQGSALPSLEKDLEALIHYMKRDKKNRNGKISFILPEKIGKVREEFLEEEKLREILAKRKI